MEVQFGQGQQPASTVAPASAPATAVNNAFPPPASPPPCCGAVARRDTKGGVVAPGGLLLGDKIPEFKDIILPRVNLVQNIGELKDSFAPGSLVFGRQSILYVPVVIDPKTGAVVSPATPPVTLTVLGFLPTKYSEKVQGGIGGVTVPTENAVTACGGTLDYKEWELKKAAGMKLFQPIADALVAVERPELCQKDETTFTYDIDGKKYALGLWALKGTSYTEAAKRVFFTARVTGILKGGYPTYCYSVSTREKSYPNNNRAWVPICTPLRMNTPTFLEFVKSVLTAPETIDSGQ